MSTLHTTPLHAWHLKNNAKMAPFAGWDMPIQYADGIIAEHMHTRTHASVFDICHMGEFLLSGPKAGEALGKALSTNIETLKVGRCRYGFLLNASGGILDDLIVYHLKDDTYMLVVNGACRAADFAAIQERLPKNLSFRDISDVTGKIDLQGPAALEVLERLIPGEWRKLPYFALAETSFDGQAIIVSRTGYTGELGYELYVPWDATEKIWERCLADSKVKAAGLGARDTLRLESGLPLYGQDLDDKHTPAEAGYASMLTSTAEYVGKKKAADIREQLVALTVAGRRSPRHNDIVLTSEGKEVGIVTSGSFAPSLGYAIALAYVKKDHATTKEFLIKAAKTEIPATNAPLPFYTKGTARIKL